MQDILKMSGICKRFPGVVALEKVDFSLRRGEVHCLLGENGAGKSTLMKVLAGAYIPEAGTIALEGKTVHFATPAQAIKAGISMIHQELNLLPELSVMENLFLGHEPQTPYGLIDWKEEEKQTQKLGRDLGIELPAHTLVGELSIANRQLVSIAKALSLGSRILIMDEPSAVLIGKELEKLFEIIRQLKEKGISIIYISHRLEEVKQIGDRLTVLRDGRLICTANVCDMEIPQIISSMVGRDLSDMYVRTAHSCSEEILRVENLTRKGFFENVSFTLHKGEILGFAGLIGAGRTEIVKSLIGADPLDSGKVFVNGKPEVIRSPMEAIDNGIGLIPEDRRNEGIVKCRSIRDNISYTILEKLSHWGIISAGKLASKTNHLMEQLEIRAPGVYSLVGQLSGGNQQKVVVAKWLAADCNVLIMDEPTRGVDVGAKAEIYGLMDELTRKGHGIILISSELPEVMGMSDRILVVSEGRITCEVDPRTTTEEEILAHALPLHDTDVRPGKEEKYEG